MTDLDAIREGLAATSPDPHLFYRSDGHLVQFDATRTAADLLAEVDRLRAENAALRAVVDAARAYMDAWDARMITTNAALGRCRSDIRFTLAALDDAP